jgi:hypothetical protein
LTSPSYICIDGVHEPVSSGGYIGRKWMGACGVADPGCFIPDPTYFQPGSSIKRVIKSKNYRFSCFLWFHEEVFKVKKMTRSGSGSRIRIRNTGSMDNKFPFLAASGHLG